MDVPGIKDRVLITDGTTADCTQASELIEGISADYLLADKGYDRNEIIEQAQNQGHDIRHPTKKKYKNSKRIR